MREFSFPVAGEAMFSSISRGVLRRSRESVRLDKGPTSSPSSEPGPVVKTIARQERLDSGLSFQPKRDNTSGNGRENQSKPASSGSSIRSSSGQVGSPRILSIGGGKGGIGKSFISANLAISLARKGYSVSLVDLDLGAANLHTCLGVSSPKVGIFDFVNSAEADLRDIAVDTGISGLRLYGGGQEFWQQVRPMSAQKIRLISMLQRLDTDYVILDLGAGTHVNTLDFFIFSHAGLLVVVPEPTSIENAYVFLKSVMFRKLQSIVKALRQEEACETLLQSIGDPKISTPPFAQLENFAAKNSLVGNKIISLTQMTKLGIVLNQVRTSADNDIGHSMSKICQRYFGFQSRFLGSTRFDDEAWKSVRNRKPICFDHSNAPSATDIAALADTVSADFLPILQNNRESGVS